MTEPANKHSSTVQSQPLKRSPCPDIDKAIVYYRGTVFEDCLPFLEALTAEKLINRERTQVRFEEESQFAQDPDERTGWQSLRRNLKYDNSSTIIILSDDHLSDSEHDVEYCKFTISQLTGSDIFNFEDYLRAKRTASETKPTQGGAPSKNEVAVTTTVKLDAPRSSDSSQPIAEQQSKADCEEKPACDASNSKLDIQNGSELTLKPDNTLPPQGNKSYPVKVGDTPSFKTTPVMRPEPALSDPSKIEHGEESDKHPSQDESPGDDLTSKKDPQVDSETPKSSSQADSPEHAGAKDLSTGRPTDLNDQEDTPPEPSSSQVLDDDTHTNAQSSNDAPKPKVDPDQTERPEQTSDGTATQPIEVTVPANGSSEGDVHTTAKDAEAETLNEDAAPTIQNDQQGTAPTHQETERPTQTEEPEVPTDQTESGKTDKIAAQASKGPGNPKSKTTKRDEPRTDIKLVTSLIENKNGKTFRDIFGDMDIHSGCSKSIDIRVPEKLKTWTKKEFPAGFIARIVRELLAGYDPHESLAELEIRKLVAQIAKIGNNINQLAKALNVANLNGDPVLLLVIVNQLETIEGDLKTLLEEQEKGATDET